MPRVRFYSQPSEGEATVDFLRRILTDPGIDALTVVVAWVKFRGVARLGLELDAFRDRGESRVILGIDEGGATRPGLVAAVRRFSEAYVYHVRGGGTFHPKLYLATGPSRAHLFVGSSNLTPGGLFTNDEVSLEAEFTLPDDADEPALADAHAYIERLFADDEVCLLLNEDLIDQLVNDPRYRVSATERRSRPTSPPLAEGAEVEDVDATGEEPGDAADPEPPFGRSQRRRTAVPALSNEARAELADIEGEEEEGEVAAPPAPPPAPPARPPVPPARPPAPPAPPPGGAQVVASWDKVMSRADAQQPERADTNPTGVLRLSRADHNIDWRTWFRRVLFGAAPWQARIDSRGNPTESANVPMDVTVAGTSHRVVNLRVDHAPHREAGQNNVPTILHWGPTLGAILRATDYHGHTVTISSLSDGSYRLDIS